jgi:hypothetical protein
MHIIKIQSVHLRTRQICTSCMRTPMRQVIIESPMYIFDVDVQERVCCRKASIYRRESFRIHQFLGTVWCLHALCELIIIERAPEYLSATRQRNVNSNLITNKNELFLYRQRYPTTFTEKRMHIERRSIVSS